MAYKAINFQGKVTFSPKLYQTYLRCVDVPTTHPTFLSGTFLPVPKLNWS